MAHAYILYSKILDKFYIGSCLNLNQRLEQHSNKTFKDSFTATADDWGLYLSIDGLTYVQARNIEAHMKKMKSKKYIKNLIAHPEIIIKLREKFK